MSQLSCLTCGSSTNTVFLSAFIHSSTRRSTTTRKTFAGKVVLITGASRGIGLETALQFARAGASLTIVARKQVALDASRDTILRERPSAQVLAFPADVRDVEKAEEAVAITVAHFGLLDILVANAAILRPSFQRACSFFITCSLEYVVLNHADLRSYLLAFASENPTTWWETIDVNIRGTYNFIQ